MQDAVKRAFKVSDGLTLFASKKIKALVGELERDGVITKQESKRIVSGLSQIKRAVYDNVTGELKKVMQARVKALSKTKNPHRPSRKKRR